MCSVGEYLLDVSRNISNLVLNTPSSPGSFPALALPQPYKEVYNVDVFIGDVNTTELNSLTAVK